MKLTLYRALEIEIKNLNNMLIEKNSAISKLEEIIKSERDEKMDLIHEHDEYRRKSEQQQDFWENETTKLRTELDNINEIVKSNQKGAEENLKVRLEEEKMLILNDQDNDRESYQKLLQEYNCLEQHCEDLEKQIHSQNRQGLMHHRSSSDVSSVSTVDENMLSNNYDMLGEDHGHGSVRSTGSLLGRYLGYKYMYFIKF